MSWRAWLVLSALLLTFVKEGAALAEVQILLHRLINPKGQGANGHCCDGRAIFCFSPCDHKLTICLDHANGSDDIRHCAYGSITTGEVTNQDKVFFTGNIGGTSNPLVFPMPSWPGRIKLKVDVVDADDHNANDFVDGLSAMVDFHPGDRAPAFTRTLTLINRVTLVLEITISCMPSFYGPHCSRRCEPRDDELGHYSCDLNNGNKLCLPGWRGHDCQDIDRDDCASRPCQHDGFCLQKSDGFVCICPTHTKGSMCEVNTKDDCVGESCANNGTCVKRESGNYCVCNPLWSGPDCKTRLVGCSDLPCLKGSTCLGEPGNVSCICAEGFTGGFCDVDVDECRLGTSRCQNNGTCVNGIGNYSCLCADGYRGARCEEAIDYCTDKPCHHGGTCTSDLTGYNCACAAGRTGAHCEEDIEECASSPCKNGGTCVEEINGYHCICGAEFTGSHCQDDLDPCRQQPCQNGGNCTSLQSDFRCVCADGFEGNVCEVKIASRLKLPFYMEGKLGDKEMSEVDSWLEDLVREYGDYRDSLIQIATQRKYVRLQDGTEATEVTLTVVINRRQLLRSEEVNAILKEVPLETLTSTQPFPLVMGMPVASASRSQHDSNSTPATPVAMPEWYVFLGVAMGLVIGVLVAFLIFRRRVSIRQKLSDVTHLYRRHSLTPPPAPIFDNNVYFVHSLDPDAEDQQPTFDHTDLQGHGQGPMVGFSSCDLDPNVQRN